MPFLEYDLPPNLIAQQPTAERDRSRLLHVNRSRSELSHHCFSELSELLHPSDLLLLNNTRVLPARLFGRRERTGGKWEGLFIQESTSGVWEMACQTRGSPRPGEFIQIEPGPLRLELLEKTAEGHWLVKPNSCGSPADILAAHGSMPLPPYIRHGHAHATDAERYQTVFAEKLGAIAAPTAGLHFTPRLFDSLRAKGIQWVYVTLHVGAGTFQPIRCADFRRHVMHREWGELSETTASAIEATRSRGGRVVAVGTTSVRVLETVAATGPIRQWSGSTNLFIYPPYEFRVVDALVTNFHLPKSTLLLLVAAFAGEELLRHAYQTAIETEYRFYSYGDAMLIS